MKRNISIKSIVNQNNTVLTGIKKIMENIFVFLKSLWTIRIADKNPGHGKFFRN